MLEQFAVMYQASTGLDIVEPAHMELAEPSIATAFTRAVAQGATSITVAPYFFFPGKHIRADIPALVEEAAKMHKG